MKMVTKLTIPIYNKTYVLTASATDSIDTNFSYSQIFAVTNNEPNKPVGYASVIRTAKNSKEQ